LKKDPFSWVFFDSVVYGLTLFKSAAILTRYAFKSTFFSRRDLQARQAWGFAQWMLRVFGLDLSTEEISCLQLSSGKSHSPHGLFCFSPDSILRALHDHASCFCG